MDDAEEENPRREAEDLPPARSRGDRFTEADNALQQLEEIERAQSDARAQGKPDKIQSIEKSKQRFNNWIKRIRSSDDLNDLE